MLVAACTVEPVDFSDKGCPCDQGFTCVDDTYCVEGTIEPPEEGLLVHWTFDDDPRDGTSDDASANGNAATCVPGACPASVPGRVGNAIELDGRAQTMSAEDHGELSTVAAFTVAVWMKPLALTLSAAVVKTRETPEGAVSWSLGIDAAGRAVLVLDGAGGETRVIAPLLGAVRVGEWAHLAVTWDGTNVRLYVGGVESASETGAIGFDAGALRAGGDGSGSSQLPWNGALDEVRLYDRVLDASRLAELAAP
jgi:hypothetical protein